MLEPGALKPVQALAASHFFKSKRLLLALPRQEGKTELGVRLLHDITRRPFTSSSLFLAKDKKSGKRATREKFLRIFDKETFAVNTELVYMKKMPSSCIFMESVDKEPDRLRGGTYSMIHWSEVAFSKIEQGHSIRDVFDKVIQPTLRQTNGYVLLESTNNGKNGWYDLWNSYRDLGFERLKISLSDMVYLGLVSEDEYEKLRKSSHPDVFRQEYECDWVTFAGHVYNEFDENTHVDPNMPGPEDWQIVVSAIDWGYHPSATCVLYAYVKGGVLNIFDEHYQLHELAAHTADAINIARDRWQIRQHATAADHEQDRIDELNRRGIACTLAQKIDVLGARMQIKEMLYFNKIKIHPRCKYLLKDLQAAVWHPKKESELDEAQCTWGHFDAEAALRYLVRELSARENDEPVKNPHIATDPISAMAFELNRERYGYDYSR